MFKNINYSYHSQDLWGSLDQEFVGEPCTKNFIALAKIFYLAFESYGGFVIIDKIAKFAWSEAPTKENQICFS